MCAPGLHHRGVALMLFRHVRWDARGGLLHDVRSVMRPSSVSSGRLAASDCNGWAGGGRGDAAAGSGGASSRADRAGGRGHDGQGGGRRRCSRLASWVSESVLLDHVAAAAARSASSCTAKRTRLIGALRNSCTTTAQFLDDALTPLRKQGGRLLQKWYRRLVPSCRPPPQRREHDWRSQCGGKPPH